jgi:hypothetical protein
MAVFTLPVAFGKIPRAGFSPFFRSFLSQKGRAALFFPAYQVFSGELPGFIWNLY